MAYAFNQAQQNPHEYGSKRWADWHVDRTRGKAAIQLDLDDEMSWNVMDASQAAAYRADGRELAELTQNGATPQQVGNVVLSAGGALTIGGGVIYGAGWYFGKTAIRYAGSRYLFGATQVSAVGVTLNYTPDNAANFVGGEAILFLAPPPLKASAAIGYGAASLPSFYNSNCAVPERC